MMEFFGIGMKVYALLELEFKSCFGKKYKVRHGFMFMNTGVTKHIFLLNM